MKKIIILSLAALLASATAPAFAQDQAAPESAEQGKSDHGKKDHGKKKGKHKKGAKAAH